MKEDNLTHSQEPEIPLSSSLMLEGKILHHYLRLYFISFDSLSIFSIDFSDYSEDCCYLHCN